MRKQRKHIGLFLLAALLIPTLYKTAHAMNEHAAAPASSQYETIVSGISETCLICEFEYAAFTAHIDFCRSEPLQFTAFFYDHYRGVHSAAFSGLNKRLRAPPAA